MDSIYLITGGTGSLGRELVKHLLTLDPQSIRIYSRNEYFQVEMKNELQDERVRYLIGDIRDRDRLTMAMKGVDYVVHTAALKHVDVCEYNPIEAVNINITGSINVIWAAIECNVKKVLAISSDKAVHPINIYGATKLLMEKLFVESGVYGDTKFSCVRFGNFWGSRGSIIPLWTEQRESGAITLTDKDMTRFWITIDEAVKFVVSCLDDMKGKEIFIPVMSEQSLEDIASQIAPGCKLNIIGKKKGEKLTELLISEDEADRVIRENGRMVILP